MLDIIIEIDSLAKIAQIFTAGAAGFIAYQVHKHNIRRDKETIREKIWAAQQQFNLECIKNPDLIKAGELSFVIDQNANYTNEDISRAVYLTFIQLNRSKLLWDAWNSKIFTRYEMEREMMPMISLVRNQEIFDYCLTRGYDKSFADDLRSIRKSAIKKFPPADSISRQFFQINANP